jgi:hypothetical protein
MVRISQDDLCLHALKIFLPKSFHTGPGPNGHEDGRFNLSMGSKNPSRPGMT